MSVLNNDTPIPGRIIITTKDVEVIYDCHRTTARRKLNKIREKCNKPEDGDVTIYDFCVYTGIPLQVIRQKIRSF